MVAVAGRVRTGKVARAAVTVMLAFVASRVLGLAREMVISSRFGTSGELDAYLAAFRVPDLLFQLMAGGALASAFIPTFAGLLAQGDEQAAWRLAGNIVNLLLVLLGVLSLLAAFLAKPLVRYVVAPGFDPERQALTASLMRIMLVTPVVFAISGTFMGILNSYQCFLAPALAPSAYNLAIILGAWFLAPRFGVYGLAIGVATGAVLHYLVQLPQVLARWRPGERLGPDPLGLASAHVREVVRLMLPRMAGLAAVQINFLVNTILASTLAPGTLATINFAWMLMLLPQGVFAQGIATAVFPTFSALAARAEVGELRRLLLRSLQAVFFLAIPATLGLVLLRTPIVSLVFQRRAFGAGSVAAVAWVLNFYALGLCAHSGIEVITRAYYALHDTRTPVGIGVAAMLLNVMLSLLLMHRMGGAGLALANTFATWMEMLALWVVLSRRLAGLSLGELRAPLAKIGIASLAMCLVLLLVQRAPLSLALRGLVGMSLGPAVFLAASAAMGVPEVMIGLERVRALLRLRR